MKPTRADQGDMEEEQYDDQPQEEVVVQGTESWLANSPWWLISTGIHAVLLLAASLYYIEKNMPIDDSEVAVVVGAKSAPVVQEIERPRDVFERKGIPKDDQVANPTDEPAIFFPEAKESDHNESADNEGYRHMKGDSKEFLSYIRGESGGTRGRKSSGVYDTMGVGVGGGSGGRYGGRFGGMAAKPGYFNPEEDMAAARADDVRRAAARRQETHSEIVTKLPSGSQESKEKPEGQEEPKAQQRKVIRSGEMEFEIESFDTSVATLTKIAVEEQGFLATVNSEKLPNGKVRGAVVVRVPPEHLDTLLLKLRALGELKSQRIGSEDVTKHYTDLESRLRAARTMEERLIRIIKEGKGEIKDLLQAERELGEWRTRIETMVGEINYYNNLIAWATLTITLYEKEIRAPFALVETERVEMGIEVEDVEAAHRHALAAIAEAKGRVTKSELKQLNAGQFNAIIQFEVAPDRAGALRDRLKQLGVLARLDINRVQETQGGSGRPQELKVQQSDTQVLVSIYNLANLAPRETVQISLASLDAEKSYKAILARVEKSGGRVVSSHLVRQKSDQTTGNIQFHLRTAEAEAVLLDVRTTGEVMKLEVIDNSDAPGSTRSKRGFNVSVYGLGAVQPRESATIVLAAKDVAQGYQALLQAVRAAEARVLRAELNENDRKNMTALVSFEIRREREKEVIDAIGKAGSVYTRNSARAQDSDTVVDSKLLLHLRLFNAASIPPRETVKFGIDVADVEAAVKAIETEFKGRIVDARHTRDASGRRESHLTIDVPLAEMRTAVERLKGMGALRDHVATKNTEVPDNELAIARLEIRIANEVLVAHDSGPWANIRRGLAISLQAGSWSLMLIMIGLCFALPLTLVLWAGVKLHRKLRPKPAPAA
jgi:hypothetical protein